eukprot:gb/GECG01011914.1/.p1 GENE.gb/GECG01011914.1/~~gb/GECG01011914.1/.p1  ORF type:complete len:226 (+),score=26.24 gb/GECG01011914.1/:1-678(+)
MPKKKGGKKGGKEKAPAEPPLPRDFTTAPPLDGCNGNVAVEHLQQNRKIHRVQSEVAEFAISKARDAGIRSVAIDGLSLHELPETIHELAYLQELNASENLLTNEVFVTLESFPTLRALNLNKNFLSGVLPEQVGALTELRELEMDDNVIDELPPEGALLNNLSVLTVRNNRLKTLSETCCMSWENLVHLDLRKKFTGRITGRNRIHDFFGKAMAGSKPIIHTSR